MERREFVKTGLAGAAVGLMTASVANAQEHDHSGHGKKAVVMPVMSKELKDVADTARACVEHATACIAECNRVLATGDAGMADCQQAVLSMTPVCEAMAANATMHLADEKLLKQLAKVCGDFCDYCADACEAHAEHYATCKKCMESCQDCSDACKAYVNA